MRRRSDPVAGKRIHSPALGYTHPLLARSQSVRFHSPLLPHPRYSIVITSHSPPPSASALASKRITTPACSRSITLSSARCAPHAATKSRRTSARRNSNARAMASRSEAGSTANSVVWKAGRASRPEGGSAEMESANPAAVVAARRARAGANCAGGQGEVDRCQWERFERAVMGQLG